MTLKKDLFTLHLLQLYHFKDFSKTGDRFNVTCNIILHYLQKYKSRIFNYKLWSFTLPATTSNFSENTQEPIKSKSKISNKIFNILNRRRWFWFHYEDIDAEDAGSITPCGWMAAMESVPTPKATSPKKPGINQIQIQYIQQDIQHSEEEEMILIPLQ